MATHYSALAWRISQTEKPGGLQCMGSQTVGHDGVTNIHTRNCSSCSNFGLWELIHLAPVLILKYPLLLFSPQDAPDSYVLGPNPRILYFSQGL